MSQSKKKLLFIIHSSAESGGAEDDILNLMEHFSKKESYQLFGMFPNAPRQDEYKRYLYKWGYLIWGYFPVINNGLFPYVKYFLKSFIQVAQILYFIKFKRFDACFLSVSVLLWPALLLKILNHKSIILIKETIEPKAVRKLIYKCIDFASEYVIPNSEMITNEYRTITGSNNAECIYSSLRGFENNREGNPVNLPVNFNESIVEVFSRRDIIKVLFIGNLVKVKNPILAVEAIFQIHTFFKMNVKLVIAGTLKIEPSYKREFDKLILRMKIEDLISTPGYCRKSELEYLYKNADLLLITSISEGIPLVMVNALKTKLPVIATRVGGIPEIIENGHNGFLVNPDPKEIAEAIITLYENNELKSSFIENGYKTYRSKFVLETNMRKLDSILEKLSI